jgi:uncharacterized LabA/DUF88 family protein
MRVRKISVLIDGGFFYKRIKSWPSINRDDPAAVAEVLRFLCKRHVQKLTGESFNAQRSRWLDHVYRLFYYDAAPYDGKPHQPFLNQQIDFKNSDQAKFREALFTELRKKRKFALRLGKVTKDGYWTPYERHLKGLLKIWHEAEYISEVLADPTKANPEKTVSAQRALEQWKNLEADGIAFPLRQKGVDMRIGLDITTMTLKRQVDTIVLVTGDSDFIPAAKVARREGVEFILDPMWQSVEDDLLEHVDGLTSSLDAPNGANNLTVTPEAD